MRHGRKNRGGLEPGVVISERYTLREKIGEVALFQVAQFAKAEPRYLASYREGLTCEGFPVDWLAVYRNRLIDLYTKWGKPAQSNHWRAEAVRFHEERLKLTEAEFGPDHANTLASMQDLVQAYRRSGNINRALPLLARLSAAKPKDIALIVRIAALQTWFSQDKEFAVTADRALRIAKNTTGPTIAARIAKACCLQPSDDKARFAAALKLARMAVKQGKTKRGFPYYQLALGMAEYRNGNFEAAENILRIITNRYQRSPYLRNTSAFYLAMSLFRQGNTTEARQLAIGTAAKMKPLPKDENNPVADKPINNDLIVWLAYKEARILIKFPPHKQPKKPAVARKPINSR